MAEEHQDHTPAYFIIGGVLIGFLVWLFYPLIISVFVEAKGVDYINLFVHIWLDRIRPAVLVLNVLLLGLFFYSWYQLRPMLPKFSIFEKPTPVKKSNKHQDAQIAQHWKVVLARARTGTPEGLRVAIQEADALVDLYLKKSGYQGETMADRLAQVLPAQVPSIDRLWEAHRLRNELVHTPGATVDAEQAKEALNAFQDFLKQLGAL